MITSCRATDHLTGRSISEQSQSATLDDGELSLSSRYRHSAHLAHLPSASLAHSPSSQFGDAFMAD